MGKSRNRGNDELDKEISEDKLNTGSTKKDRVKNRRKEMMGAIEESITLGIELDIPDNSGYDL